MLSELRAVGVAPLAADQGCGVERQVCRLFAGSLRAKAATVTAEGALVYLVHAAEDAALAEAIAELSSYGLRVSAGAGETLSDMCRPTVC